MSPERKLLERIINEAGRQIDLEKPDLDAVAAILDGYRPADSAPLTPAADLVPQFRNLPKGPEIPSLKRVSDATGGMFGLWAIAGEPGVGKSTLVDQLAYTWLRNDQAQVLKYDYEGGPFVSLPRMMIAAEAAGRADTLLARLERMYFRDDASTLDLDTLIVTPPAMIIVDSFQSLDAKVDNERQSLDRWLRRFEEYARAGYWVVLVSEKPRSAYGEALLSGFKGTGGVEYKAWVGAQLVGDIRDHRAPIEFHLVKNRMREDRGHICDLVRDRDMRFWFREVTSGPGSSSEID